MDAGAPLNEMSSDRLIKWNQSAMETLVSCRARDAVKRETRERKLIGVVGANIAATRSNLFES